MILFGETDRQAEDPGCRSLASDLATNRLLTATGVSAVNERHAL